MIEGTGIDSDEADETDETDVGVGVDSDSIVVLETDDNNEGTDGDSTTGVGGTLSERGSIVRVLSVSDSGTSVDSRATSSRTNGVVTVVGVEGPGLGGGTSSVRGVASNDSDSTVDGGNGNAAAYSSSSGIVGTMDGAYKLAKSSSRMLGVSECILIVGDLVSVDISSGTLGSASSEGSSTTGDSGVTSETIADPGSTGVSSPSGVSSSGSVSTSGSGSSSSSGSDGGW